MSAKSTAIRTIWMLSREYGQLAGAGGVKDVAKQLAEALGRWPGRQVNVVLPCYGFIDPVQLGFEKVGDPLSPERGLRFDVEMNYALKERRETLQVWTAKQNRVNVYLLEAERFLEKSDVYTYTLAEEQKNSQHQKGMGHFDYFATNILLQKGALTLMMLLGVHPDIIHCHDGHTAIVPALIHEHEGMRHYFRNTGTVVTLHNGGRGYHQEVADLPFARAVTGLPWKVIYDNCLKNAFDPFMVAGRYALLNTVSEEYARELQETDEDILTDWLGHHLLERGVKLQGVTNGIDPDEFDPTSPEKVGIAAPFDPVNDTVLSGKQLCKQAFLEKVDGNTRLKGVLQTGYIEPDTTAPLVTFIGRLSAQKGLDILITALDTLLKQEQQVQVVVLGSGGYDEEDALIRLAERSGNVGRVCFLRGFSPQIANEIYAAGDFFLIPSVYEPCGLTDYIAQLFGNLPIVHHVGGLVKVLDGKTGFSYQLQTAESLGDAMTRALAVYRDKKRLRTMQREAVLEIRRKYTWAKVIQKYLKLYKQAKIQRGHQR